MTENRQVEPSRQTGGSEWRLARSRAEEYVDGRRDLGDLLLRGWERLQERSREQLGDMSEDVDALLRLVGAYRRGEYRDVDAGNLILIVAGVVYFVSPIDLVPDWLGRLGLKDDAFVMSLVLRVVGDELDRFRDWEQRREAERHEMPSLPVRPRR